MPIQKLSKHLKNNRISEINDSQLLPIIEIDSMLISWGLLRGKYHNNNTIEVKKEYLYHNWFVIILMGLTLPKYIIAITFDDDSYRIYKYGDIGWFYGHRRMVLSWGYFHSLF